MPNPADLADRSGGDFSDFSGVTVTAVEQRGQLGAAAHSTTLFRGQRVKSFNSISDTLHAQTPHKLLAALAKGVVHTPSASFPVLSCAFYFAGEIRILVGTERVPIARYEVSFHVHLRFMFVLNSLRHRSLQYPQGSTHAA